MFTEIVSAQTDATDLKTLMEAAGRVFPNDNDTCIGLIIQIDPASVATVDVLSTGESAGITLSAGGVPSISFREFRIGNVYLKASAADVPVNVLVEQVGG